MILVAAMLLSVTACGSNGDTSSAQNSETSSAVSEAVSSEAEVSAEVEEVSSAAETPDSVTIQAYNANSGLVDVEVPYDPQRIAILDMAALDVVDCPGGR